MDYASIHNQFKTLVSSNQVTEAIELIVPFAERTDLNRETACSAINTLVFSALIPEQRFVESIAWLEDSIHGDYGYESWNSVSNLGHVYLRLGQVERARTLFTTLLQAQYGPIDEATEFLEIINSGNADSLYLNMPDPRENDAYKQILVYLEKNGADQELVQAFNLSKGGAIHGFVQGVLSADEIQKLDPTHDAIAQALRDFITKDSADPDPTYADSVEAMYSGTATKGHVRIIREMAYQAHPGAAAIMYTYAQKNQRYAEPWRNVAVARGELMSYELMSSSELIEEMTNSIEPLESKVDKAEAGKDFIENFGLANLIEVLTHWFETGPAEDTEQYFESVGRRVLWVYPNGLTVTIGAEINLTIARIDVQLSESSVLPEVCAEDNWDFLQHANGWASNHRYDKDTMLEIIQSLEDLHGKPKLILPWERRAENTSEEEEEDYVFPDPEDDNYNDYLDVYRLMNLVHSGDIVYFSEWELEVVFEDDHMNPFSHFEKYQSFTEALRESKLAVLDLEEHCSACSSGVTEMAVEEDPEMEGKPLFITWSQNSNGMVRPDGAINIEGHCWDADADTMEKIKAIADGLGVPCEIGDGVLHFVSPDWE